MFKEIYQKKYYILPFLSLILILLGWLTRKNIFYLVPLFLGIFNFLKESYEKIKEKKFSLDYIAFLALTLSLYLKEYFAGAIIGLMYLGSTTLENYGSEKAEKNLKKLIESFPKVCQTKDGRILPLNQVKENEIIIIKNNEIVPLDGHLVSSEAVFNEANLTGESMPKIYKKGDFVKSGVINIGPTIEIKVEGDFSTSSYQKILKLVEEAKKEPAPFVRLAEKFNIVFTLITFALAIGAWLIFKDSQRVLAVLVIATPCPLLIAVPLSFIGGISRATKNNIIVKKTISFEILEKINFIFFDKTGTLTLGESKLKKIEIQKPEYDEDYILKIAGSLEQHSIHPLAKAVVNYAQKRVSEFLPVEDFKEQLGEGIRGKINGKLYHLVKSQKKVEGIGVDLWEEENLIATLIFDDPLKEDAKKVLKELSVNYNLGILSGDRKENVLRYFGQDFPEEKLKIFAECLPDEKLKIVKDFKNKGFKVALVGDGINDAPAMAIADVGIVFSGTENSATIEAADIAILSPQVSKIKEILDIAKNSVKIARQSLFVGIGLSFLGMIFAFFGFIPPVIGAILQEIIDLVVIVNSLRSSF